MVPPFVGVAVNVILLPAQIEVELAEIDTEGVTEPVELIAITFEVTVGIVVQFAFDVIITPTWSAFISALVVKVGELVPVFTEFICH